MQCLSASTMHHISVRWQSSRRSVLRAAAALGCTSCRGRSRKGWALLFDPQLLYATRTSNDLLTRFENLLNRYYSEGTYRTHGLPTVKYCAQEFFLSPNYFGDLIRQMTDDTAGNIIRRFLMQRAQKMLISGVSVGETAEQLGFEYPQHFTRMFKKYFGISPSQYIKRKQ